MNAWETKAWGRTRCTIDNLHFSRHELELYAHGFCSAHYHGHRSNRFVVFSGKVRVVTAYGWTLHHIDLVEGMSYSVRAHAVHQFQVLRPGVMIEEYYPDGHGAVVVQSDIHRLSVGGMLEQIDESKPGLILPDGTLWESNSWTTPSL